MTPGWRHASAGFTLLELLVAMAIFAVIGALALGGLNAVLGQRDIAGKQLERLHQVQRAMRVMTNDFADLNPRYVRDVLGTGTGCASKKPLESPCDVDVLVCLSRSGWRNPFAARPRGELQRVQYRVDDGKLIREYWPVMDRILVTEPRKETLVDNVDGVDITYLDAGGEFVPGWPPLEKGTTQAPAGEFPPAVKIALRLKDWGEIDRYLEVAQ